jgi:hypothetical protein
VRKVLTTNGKHGRMYYIDVEFDDVAQEGKTYRVSLSFRDFKGDGTINVFVKQFDNFMMGLWMALCAILDLETVR